MSHNDTGDTAGRLPAPLVCRPEAFDRDRLYAVPRDAGAPTVHAWAINHVVARSPHAEPLRLAWFDDADPVVASAGCTSPFAPVWITETVRRRSAKSA